MKISRILIKYLLDSPTLLSFDETVTSFPFVSEILIKLSFDRFLDGMSGASDRENILTLSWAPEVQSMADRLKWRSISKSFTYLGTSGAISSAWNLQLPQRDVRQTSWVDQHLLILGWTAPTCQSGLDVLKRQAKLMLVQTRVYWTE